MSKIVNQLHSRLGEIGHSTVKNYKTDLMADMAAVFDHYIETGAFPSEVHIYARENGTNMWIDNGGPVDCPENSALRYYYSSQEAHHFDPTMIVYVLKFNLEAETVTFDFVGTLPNYSVRYNVRGDHKRYIAALNHYWAKKVLQKAKEDGREMDAAHVKFAVSRLWSYHHLGQMSAERVQSYIMRLSYTQTDIDAVLEQVRAEHERLIAKA